MTEPVLMVGLGEILWDLFPSGKALGGAPANFAYMANVLGDKGVVASRVGSDELGHQARAMLKRLGLSTSYLQQDDQRDTGTASVIIDSLGEPAFTIKGSIAWDSLEWTADWEELSTQADVVCFGSLAQRSSTSARTIECFLEHTRPKALRICDINLRPPHYNSEVLSKCLRHANIIKLTDQELQQLSSLIGWDFGDQDILARRMLEAFDLKLICVTRGARGSLLIDRDGTVEHEGFRVNVVDAVGAGDAFTACMAHGYMRGKSLNEISVSANRFASWVTTQRGATPELDSERLRAILSGAFLQQVRQAPVSCERK